MGSVNNVNRFLNIEDSHLRVVSGNVYAQALNVGGITVGSAHGLQSVTNVSNTTSNTIEFTNTETSLVTSGDINMLHSSNNAAIKLNSNVVTEFPRSKKLIKYPRVVLTANGLNQGYTVSGSDDYSTGLTFYGAFTPPTTLSSPSGAWLTPTSGTTGYSTSTGEYLLSAQLHNGSLTGEYVQIVLPERINPVYFTVQPRPESANNNQGLLSCINEGEIWASDDSGTTWTPVGTIQNFTPTGLYQEYIVDNFNVPGYYDTFALIIHKNNGQTFAGVGEWKIFGTPEYDPDAAGVDVKVTSYPNVPNTDWLEVYYDAKDLTAMPSIVTDLSPNSNGGSVTGATLDTTDGIESFKFNGSSQYVTGTHGLTTGSDPVHTISLWFKRTARVNQFDYLVQLGEGGTSHQQSAIFIGVDDKIRHGHWGSGVYLTDVITDNVWYHVAATFTGGNTSDLSTHKIYVNGVEKGINAYSSDGPLVLTGTALTLGRNENALGSPGGYFNGSIANFRLFNRALSQDEVWQLYAYQKEYFGHGDLGMTLKAGRLGIGTSEPRAALDVRGDLFGPGIVQVQSTTFDGITSGNSNSFTTLPGLTTRITPKKPGSKILVLLNLFWSGSDDSYFQGNVKKDGSVLVKQEGSVGSASKTSFAMLNYDRGIYFLGNIGFSYLDDANIGTEEIEYTVEVRNRYTGSTSWYINYTSNTADANRLTAVSTLTLIEIQQ